jgi:hypothetical protein
VTEKERQAAIKQLVKHGGAHLQKPPNRLIGDSPAETVERCKGIVSWFAQIEIEGEGDWAKINTLHGVVDALEHAETVLRQVGSLADPLKDGLAEVSHG